MANKERNILIDSLKGWLCISILFLHLNSSFYWANVAIYALGRIATGCFFILSGYLIAQKDNVEPDYYKHKSISVFKMTLFHMFIIVLMIYGWISVINKRAVPIKVIFPDDEFPIPIDAIKFLFFTIPPLKGCGHLWFIFAESYSFMLIYFLKKINREKVLDYLSIICFAIFCILQPILPFGEVHIIYANWFFWGLPMIWLGHKIGKIKPERFKEKQKEIKLFLLFGFLLYLGYIAIKMIPQPDYNFLMYISFPIPGFIFLLGVIFYLLSLPQPNENLLSKIGKKHSTFIYIYHIPFGILYSSLFFLIWPNGNPNIMWDTCGPIVLASCIIVSNVVNKYKAQKKGKLNGTK